MRTSSVMSLLICIAICDLLSMICLISYDHIKLRLPIQDCTPPNSLLELQVFTILEAVRDDVIRCSTWLSVSMALIRFLFLKLAAKGGSGRISSFKFGFNLFIGTLTVSSIFSICNSLKWKFDYLRVWKPEESCPDTSFASEPLYERHVSDLFLSHNALLLWIFMFSNGTFSKIIPCLLFPILTGLLILELRKAKSSNSRNNTELSTGLVIYNAVSFFTALLPTGIMTSLQAVFTDIGFWYTSARVDRICYTLLTLNATLHCFICFAMSTQYRNTVRNLLRISKIQKHKQSVASSLAQRL